MEETAIVIEDAHAHNLRSISCRMPKNAITVVSGPSGSGKTSLALDTLLAESIFRTASLSALDARAQARFQPRRPAVGEIRNLSPVAFLDRRARGGVRHTVASFLGLGTLLWPLLAAWGVRRCTRCGTGVIVSTSPADGAARVLRECRGKTVSISAVLARSGLEGALERAVGHGYSLLLCGGRFVSMDAGEHELGRSEPDADAPAVVIDRVDALPENAARIREAVDLANSVQEAGIAIDAVEADAKQAARLFIFSEAGLCRRCAAPALPLHETLLSLRCAEPAGSCCTLALLEGMSALTPAELAGIGAATLGQASLAELLSGSCAELRAAVSPFAEAPAGAAPVEAARQAARSLRAILERAEGIGLGHLGLLRRFASLSFGEAQRMRLLGRFRHTLSGMTYILDEPTIGLHPSDIDSLWALLCEVRAQGNTLVLIEHDRRCVERADHAIVLGPGAGPQGGRVVYEGAPAGRPQPPRAAALQPRRPQPQGWIRLAGARLHNLKQISVDLPLQSLICIAGVSGSGKSTLAFDTLGAALQAIAHGGLDQAVLQRLELSGISCELPVSKVLMSPHLAGVTSPLSFVATYTGLLTPLRSFFAALPLAKLRGLAPAAFSPQTGGCPRCGGTGSEPGYGAASLACAECGGRRFPEAALQVRYKGLSIADVFALSVDQAAGMLGVIKGCSTPLQLLQRFHLEHLQLGQPLAAVSDGEMQRLQLLRELARRRSGAVYIFEEPTSGLDEAEVANLLDVFRAVTAAGSTVVAIEHRLSFIRGSDYVVELGPGAGAEGGRIVAACAPAQLSGADTATGRALANES